MSNISGFDQGTINRILTDMSRSAQMDKRANVETEGPASTGKSFLDMVKESVGEVNDMQKAADTMSSEVASGKNMDLHETMLATTQAELSFNLMIQIRNKVLDAYQEVMRLPV